MRYVYQVAVKEFFTLEEYEYQCTDAGMSANIYSSEAKAYKEYKRLCENYKLWYPKSEEENLFPNQHTILYGENGSKVIISIYKIEVQ